MAPASPRDNAKAGMYMFCLSAVVAALCLGGAVATAWMSGETSSQTTQAACLCALMLLCSCSCSARLPVPT